MKAYEMQQKEIARQEAIIARYRAFNREKSIRAAESREKRLEKMERLEKPVEEGAIHFRFDIRRRTGEDVLMGEELAKGLRGPGAVFPREAAPAGRGPGGPHRGQRRGQVHPAQVHHWPGTF